jgi:hypothetical protein
MIIMATPQTLKQAEEYAAANGILLSPAERQRIGAIQASEQARLTTLTPNARPDLADRWNKFYPRLLQSIISIGETVLTFSQTVIVALGVPIVLLLLLVVEHQRVVHGIRLFEVDEHLASFAAMSLVLLNLVLEFQIHHIEHVAGYADERGRRWSLRIWATNMLYTLGIGEQWQAVYLSPAARYKRLLRLVTFSILALALVGSMRVVISDQPGTWYEALSHIVTSSSLLEMLTWLGGTLFAAAAVLAAQGLCRYVAIRCVEIIGAMNMQQAAHRDDPIQVEVEQAGAIAAMAMINEKIAIKQKKMAGGQRSDTPKEEGTTILPPGLPFGATALGLGQDNPGNTSMNGHANAHGNGSMTSANGQGSREK